MEINMEARNERWGKTSYLSVIKSLVIALYSDQ